MSVTLKRLLRIEGGFPKAQHYMAFEFAEKFWRESGCPCDEASVADVLERALCLSTERGLEYPAVMLARRKQLQRGSLKLELSTQPPTASTKEPSARVTAGCTRCEGYGWFQQNGRALLCTCSARMRPHNRR